ATLNPNRRELRVGAEVEGRHAGIRGVKIADANGALHVDVGGGDTDRAEIGTENGITREDAAEGRETTGIVRIGNNLKASDVRRVIATGLSFREQPLIDGRGRT